ncbi:protein-disulfide reductase DsbD family protein [Sphingomicrobium nitratireducens]|uniref:protein-disulfide reductase DsbD family protein n=1 Tax=Sphingomicrobium nitratireducens TaxID=2964666 RepID=UPI00223FBD4E|nr:thioredoxin family protein [Sphingomicrobium nitratireducens]
MFTRLMLLLTILFAAAPAAAQTTHIVPHLVAEGPVPAEGGTVELALVMETEPGWHGYWLNPGDAGLPLRIEWRLPEGASVGELRYPTPVKLEAAGLINYVYKSDHAILVTLTVPPTDRAVLRIEGEGRWLACTDIVCVPEKGTFALALLVGDGPSRTDEFDAYRAKLPRELASEGRFSLSDNTVRIAVPLPASATLGKPSLFLAEDKVIDYAAPQRFLRSGDWLVAELARRGTGDPRRLSGVIDIGEGQGLAFDAAPGEVPAGGKPVGGLGAGTVLVAILGALVGGLFLNLMPCVFPILAMKAMHLARAGGDKEEARREALGYTAGAVVGTALLGAVLLALRAGGTAAGWAFQLQDPRTIFLLVLLAGAITANLMGLYRLPVLAGEMRRGGHFGTGALAAFVATPCAGPFLGAALGTALILPPAGAIGVFAALGLGLALPFLAIAFVPALRKRLPRPGPWMQRLQRLLAIPMFATLVGALWLLWRLAGSEALLLALGALVLLLCLLLLSRRGLALGWVAMGGALALAVAGAMLLPDRPSAEARAPDFAEVWSEDAVAAARAEGRPVFVYFTADWCLTCKVNEAGAIDREATLAAFEQADVAVFVADWTQDDPAITRFLDARGRAAVPLYLWYAPGREAEELPQVLTPSMLVERAQSAAR